MGEDFFDRRNERFATLRDVRYERVLQPDLFSACPQATQTTAVGDAVAEVAVGLELWGKVTEAGPVAFYAGDIATVMVDGASAEHLRREHGPDAPLVATIVDIEPDLGIVRLALGCVE